MYMWLTAQISQWRVSSAVDQLTRVKEERVPKKRRAVGEAMKGREKQENGRREL